MKILDYKGYYFLGIGGIGMSALARYFRHYGKKVGGYDKSRSELTLQLEEEGITCHYEDDAGVFDGFAKGLDRNTMLVVYTPAVPQDLAELKEARARGFALLKRSQVLGEITRQFRTIAVAGTHGKTTTTTMISHLLRSAGINCFSFMGGISAN